MSVNAEENDNVDSEDVVTKQTAKISFNQHEPMRLDVLKTMRDGLDTITDSSDSFEIESGDSTTLPKFIIRITGLNDGYTFWLIGYKANIAKGFMFEFQKDDAEDRRIKQPIEINLKTDPTYNNGMVYKLHYDGGV